MPWNEPGGGKDPWSQKPTNQQGPPDLDELLRKLTDRFGGLFGGKSGGRSGGASSGGGRGMSIGALLIGAVVLVVWLGSGIYIVDPGEAGVELRFGAFQSTTGPGPHWHIPYPVETVEVVNVSEIRSTQHNATMLTQDENIVAVELAAQYLVNEPEDYLFQVRLPDATLRQVMESALREVVGKSKMDYILAEGRADIAQRTMKIMQDTLNDYHTGLQVTTVNMQQAQPPEQVQDAFNDAIKAREDEVKFRNQAEAYANGIIPQARGEAARVEQEADAYRDRVVAHSEGRAARFTKLLTEYNKAPEVTRERLYLDAIESVMAETSKVMVDVKGGNNLLYLPLERLMSAGAMGGASGDATRAGNPAQGTVSGGSTRPGRTTIREGR